MNIEESLKSAVKSLKGNKARSFLTMLGIIIGIASVITMSAIGRGGQENITGNLKKTGYGKFTVYVDKEDQTFRWKYLLDDDTIEKLKSLGKTWQDKRIYFKELNNSYYDLVSEKWVTDSPETTKKAIEMASESLDDRENRLANAKKEAEEKKKREYEEKEAKEKPLRNNVANKIKNKEEFSKQVIEKIKEHGYNFIDKGSINKIANELFTEDELNAWKNANPYSRDIKEVLNNGDYTYSSNDEIGITPKGLIYDIMKNHFYAKKQNDKPLSFEDFLEITNDTILDMHSKSEAWEMYGAEYRDYLREHKKRLNNN